MRSPERIEHITQLLEQIWKKDSDMRFMQLVYVLQARFSQANDGMGAICDSKVDGFTRTGYDLFNVEDDQIECFLKEYLGEEAEG